MTADLIIGALQIVRDAAEPRAAMNGGDAAHALAADTWRRRPPARASSAVCTNGHHDRLRARIEHALDEHLIVPGEPHDRIGRRAADGAQDVGQVRDFDRHVLHVDDEEVEAAIAHAPRRSQVLPP